MEGRDDHQWDLYREEDPDDDNEHHCGVVSLSLPLVVAAPPMKD